MNINFKDWFNQSLNECVIASIMLNDNFVLVKNRDRGYKAKVEIVHEIINGTEVVYWHDMDTDWSEGINEFGIGIVNSSLLVRKDEKEGKEVNDKKDKQIPKKKSDKSDGRKIRHGLSFANTKDVIDFIANEKDSLKGQTLISDGKKSYVLEITKKYKPVIKPIDDKITVRTNHGVYHKDVGYTVGKKKLSSHTRMELAQDNLKDAKNSKEILDALKEKRNDDPFLNPYRIKNPFNMQTTGQIYLDLKNKQVIIRMDKEQGIFKGINNKLPKGYKPKIKLKIIH